MDGLAPLVNLITGTGPYGLVVALMIYLMRQERQERLESQERERALAQQVLVSMTKTTNALRSLRYVLLHGHAPEPQEYEAEDVG